MPHERAVELSRLPVSFERSIYLTGTIHKTEKLAGFRFEALRSTSTPTDASGTPRSLNDDEQCSIGYARLSPEHRHSTEKSDSGAVLAACKYGWSGVAYSSALLPFFFLPLVIAASPVFFWCTMNLV